MTRLFTETYGTGEPLVLVHGWAMHSGIWHDFAKSLAERYKVICVDLPGHGRSASIPFIHDQIVNDLSKAIPDEPCCWLGWSMGAAIVLEMAKHYPQRIASLILLAGSPCFIAQQDWPGLSAQNLELFQSGVHKQPQATMARFLTLEVQGEPDARFLLKKLKSTLADYAAPDKQTLLSGLDILRHADLRQTIAQLNVPVLVCLGEKDVLVPVTAGKSIQDLLPEVEIFIVQNAGHVMFLSHESEVVNRLFDFIKLS